MFFSYLLALTIEILVKLKKTTIVSYTKRSMIYHIYAVAISAFFCFLGLTTNDFGESSIGACYLVDKKTTRFVYISYIFGNILAVWGMLIYAWKDIKSSSSGILFNYVLVVVAVSVTVSMSETMDLMANLSSGSKKENYKDVGVIFGSMTGMGIALARLSNRKLMRKLWYKVFYSKKKQLRDSILSVMEPEEIQSPEISSLGEFFDSITKKVFFIQTLHQMLSLLYLRFESNTDGTTVYNTTEKSTDYIFTEKMAERVLKQDYIRRNRNS
jgi:hypothetical protein